MSRVPISDGPQAAIVADASEYDPVLGVYTLFFVIPRAEVVYFRLIIESWEDCAVPRTMDRFLESDRARSVVVALAVPDFLVSSVRRLTRLCAEIDGRQIRSTPALREKLRRDLLDGTEAS